MRISSLLRVSFAGSLFFTPAMADEIEKVHEEALRVLREHMAQNPRSASATSNPAPAGSTSISPDSSRRYENEVARQRAEREQRLDAEAQKRLAERAVQQAEERRQFEQFMSERQRLRQQQRTQDESIVRSAGQPMPATSGSAGSASIEDVHAKALEVLRSATAQPSGGRRISGASSTRGVSSSGLRVTEAEIAPKIVAPGSNADVHARALEVLRSAQQSPAPRQASSTQAAFTTPPQVTTSAPAMASTPASAADVHEKALQVLRQAQSAPPVTQPATSVLDSRTREIIERQDREIARRTQTESVRPVQPATYDSSAETRARQVLRQQQQEMAGSSTVGNVHAAPAATTAITTAPVVPAPSAPDAGYSRELEERAREVLRQRANEPMQAAPSVAAPTPRPAAPDQPIPSPSAPVQAQQQALEALRQASSAPAAQSNVTPSGPKTKRERLRELTELYIADKMTPAEYHQRRAQILAEPGP